MTLPVVWLPEADAILRKLNGGGPQDTLILVFGKPEIEIPDHAKTPA